MEDDFRSKASQWRYWVWCLVALLAFLTTTQVSYLPVLLRRVGYSELQAALVMGAWSIPVIPSALIAGPMIRRRGASVTTLAGLTLTLFGFCAMEIAPLKPLAMIGARLVQGVGFGLLVPAMMVAVKAQLGPARETYLLGVFSAMIVIPQLVSPSFAQFYAETWHLEGYFVFTALPLLMALVLAATLFEPSNRTSPDVAGYSTMLLDRNARGPLLAMSVTGGVWGFAAALLALLLNDRGQSVGDFFSAFGITALVSRFFLMRKIDRLAPTVAIGGALGITAVAMAIIGSSVSQPALFAAAVAYGVGYSVAYPCTIVWGANFYAEAYRAKPIALMNATFHASGLVVIVVGGACLHAVPHYVVAWALALLALTGALVVHAEGQSRLRQRGGSA